MTAFVDDKSYKDQVCDFLDLLAESNIRVEKIIFNYAEQSIRGKCVKIEIYRLSTSNKYDHYTIDVLYPRTKDVIGEGLLIKVYGDDYI